MPFRLLIILLFLCFGASAQTDRHNIPLLPADTAKNLIINKSDDVLKNQVDVVDIVGMVIPKFKRKIVDSSKINTKKFRIGGPVPAAGFSLSTGFAVAVAANGSFIADTGANTSTFLTQCVYTQYHQLMLPLLSSIWAKENKYNIIIDWRYLYYPSNTFGLGGYTTADDGYLVNYNAIKLHQTVLRQLATNLYAGLGYNIDYYWGIQEVKPPSTKPTDFETYGYSKTEVASGITLNLSYDSRKNAINPERGSFANIIYRPNPTFMGNSTNWSSLIMDFRKYIKFPIQSHNVLALWNYTWLTLDGKPPYLMLPYTGGDAYGNFGRGYVIGRFRSPNVIYCEGEYRFQILRNGLLGGVVFANAQSFSELSNNKFETIAPGYGAGIRIKFNKFSRTSGAIDYAFGINGSQGIFVNLGEVF